MWKYEQEFRIDKPETVGEKDKHFDLDNYKDWLEEQLTDCRKQLSIQRVVGQSEQLCEHRSLQSAMCEVDYCPDCETYIPS
jgi:hypothetical protein